jgi:hypothetical protein
VYAEVASAETWSVPEYTGLRLDCGASDSRGRDFDSGTQVFSLEVLKRGRPVPRFGVERGLRRVFEDEDEETPPIEKGDRLFSLPWIYIAIVRSTDDREPCCSSTTALMRTDNKVAYRQDSPYYAKNI